MKHWETGNGSLLTTHSNFPSFSFSKWTVAAASLSWHAVVLHTSGFIKHKMHREQHHGRTCHSYRIEEAGKHHYVGRRERQSPQSPGDKSVPEQRHSECCLAKGRSHRSVMNRATGSRVLTSCSRHSSVAFWIYSLHYKHYFCQSVPVSYFSAKCPLCKHWGMLNSERKGKPQKKWPFFCISLFTQ